jgi:primosomal protein N'
MADELIRCPECGYTAICPACAKKDKEIAALRRELEQEKETRAKAL